MAKFSPESLNNIDEFYKWKWNVNHISKFNFIVILALTRDVNFFLKMNKNKK